MNSLKKIAVFINKNKQLQKLKKQTKKNPPKDDIVPQGQNYQIFLTFWELREKMNRQELCVFKICGLMSAEFLFEGFIIIY